MQVGVCTLTIPFETNLRFLVTFIALNVVRFISLVALLLVFSSSIVVLVSDIRAVNKFATTPEAADSPALINVSNSTSTSCDAQDTGYIL